MALNISNDTIITTFNNTKTDKLVVSIHITHHAGTFLCHAAEYNQVPIPTKACMTKGLTDLDFSKWKRLYGYFAVEYRKPPKKLLTAGHWERDDVVSVVIMRNPMDRLLAGDAISEAIYGKPPTRTAQQWWDYAHDDAFTNNYALRVFSGGDVSEVGLTKAKSLLNRMTYIMDQACLNDNMAKLGDILGWDMTRLFYRFRSKQRILQTRPSARERIANDTLYDFLVERNKHDIELYEWSKKQSLVVCGGDSDAIGVNNVASKSVKPAVPQAINVIVNASTAVPTEMIMPDQLVNVKLSRNTAPRLTLAVGLVILIYKLAFRGRRTKIALKAT